MGETSYIGVPHNRTALASRMNICATVRPLLYEARVEILYGRGWEPIPLSDPSDIKLVRGGFMELGLGSCCLLLPP